MSIFDNLDYGKIKERIIGFIKEFCKDKIARYKIPKHIKFIDKFPMTGSGKIQKFKLREIAKKELGIIEVKNKWTRI